MDFLNHTFSLRVKYLVFGFYVISCCLSTSLRAAERVPLQRLSFKQLQNIIPVSLSNNPSKQLIAPTNDLLLVEQHLDTQSTAHIRMQQQYAGFPVFGGYAIFHHKKSVFLADSVSMNGAIYQHLQQDLGVAPAWFLTKADAVLQQYIQRFPQDQITESMVVPMIFVDNTYHAIWAYQLSVYLQPEAGIPSRPSEIVDAKTGQILLSWDDLTTMWQRVHGMGFGGNQRVGKRQFGKDFPYLDMLRDDNTGLCFLENPEVRVVNMEHRTQQVNAPMHFDCDEEIQKDTFWTGEDGDGYDLVNGAYSASNDAMYSGGIVKEMFQKRYGLDVLRTGHQPMKLVLRVHYSHQYANAFWDGRQMTFGDGDGGIYPLVSLGITAHELSHGFTQQHSGLVYYGQAGAMNESFSDMAAQAVEYYVYGKCSWLIGADIVKGHGALRFLKQPSRDGMSIERADQYRKDLDVHYTSGVYNNLYYVLSNRPGWDPSRAFQVMLKANMDYWTPTSTFAEGACGIIRATQDLGFEVDDVTYALDEVMIDYDECLE